MTETQPTTLRVGYVPGVILTKWRRIWAERFPRIALESSEVAEDGAKAALDADQFDACFVRLPIDTDGLHLIPLYEEQPVVWVHKEHAIAAFDEVSQADLIDETVLTAVTTVNIDRVVAQAAVLRVPLSVARTDNRRDLVYRPVNDAEPTRIGLAWPQAKDSALIQEFVGVVRGRSAASSRTSAERQARKPAQPAKTQPKTKPRKRR